MLARMILGGRGAALPGNPAEYIVSSDAEWDAALKMGPAMLAGSTLVVTGTNFTQRTISDLDMSPFGRPLVIRSADASASLPSVELRGTVRGIDFSGLNFQMTGWPRDFGACVVFGTGTFGRLRFIEGTTFRHGYGANLIDFDTAADLPEYLRVDNVWSATTISSTYALAWQYSSAPSGWIEFFNRGSQTVFVAVGGSGITATSASASCAPGARLRLSPLDPAVDTHFAILSEAGTSEVNARTEIGLGTYLGSAFQQTGGAVLEDFELRNCLFRDLSNAVKGLRPTRSGIVMDCDFDRIYQDIIALSPDPGASLHILRNIESLPFARSGIAEDLQGDARDPHGDQFQMFSNASPAATVGPVYYAGNRVRLTPRRSGIRSQGIFVSDNDFDPSFTGLYFISTMQVGGAGRALSLGEESTGFKVRDAFVYGATILDGADINIDLPFVMIDHDDDGTVYIGKTIATDFRVTDADWQRDGNLLLADALDRNAVFPNFGAYPVATDRPSIDAALVTAAEGAGLGAIATADAIDWTASDPDQVILWERLPSGAHWNALDRQAPGSEIVLPLRKILNRRPSQTVVPGPGTEWRSVDADGTTLVQGWTSGNGTIEPDQFIQIRHAAADISNVAVTASITINGFEQSVRITSSVEPVAYLQQGNPIGYFEDPASVPPGTIRITARGKFLFPAAIPNNAKPFAQVSTGCDLILQSNGSMNATVEDGTGAKMMTNLPVAPANSLAPDTWHDIEFDVDHAAGLVRVILDGAVFTTPFEAAGNGVFQSSRAFLFVAGANGNTPVTTGTRIADLSVDFNGVRHKTISNDAANANADPWHKGGDF